METMEKSIPAKVKTVKEEPCEITLSVELPSEEVAKETDTVYRNIQTRASLPGFRMGKAPLELIRKNFSQTARQKVLENLVSRAASQVLRERKLQTIDTPRIEKIAFEEGRPLSFHMKVEKDPEFKAKDYKGIKTTRRQVKITDEKIQKTLEEIRERNASLVASSATQVDKHHFIVIDFEGKIEGKTFPGGSAANYLMDMNAPQTIAGFSEGLFGAPLNESRAVSVRFPADYPRKEWAGKEAVFQVTVKEIKEKKLPLLDDDFAKDLGASSLNDLRQKVRENLEKEEKTKADKEMEDLLIQSLLDNHRFPLPPTLVEERTRLLMQRTRRMLEQQGLLKSEDAQADTALRERARPQAEKDIRLSYILKAIASQEKLEASEADVDDLKKKALEENKDKPEDVETYFKDRWLSIQASLTEGKVLDFLKKNAKIKTVEA